MVRLCPDVEYFLQSSDALNHKVFKDCRYPYNLNIVGWRNLEGEVNRFEDWLAVYWLHSGKWLYKAFQCTTVPGIHYLHNLMSSKGTAVLVPGQYLGCYTFGKHKGKDALVQSVGVVGVYRDSNKDSIIDYNPTTLDIGYFGINIHRAGVWSKLVGNWSAGCQVISKEKDFLEFFKLCMRSYHAGWPNSFTYTLMEF